MVHLDTVTMADAASDFGSLQRVPPVALTMGVETILEAREVILMATGEAKATIVKKMVEEEVTDKLPASWLQRHDRVVVVLDRGAAEQLTRTVQPWSVFPEQWNLVDSERNMIMAVQALCKKLEKGMFSLTVEDFEREHMHVPRGWVADDVIRKVYDAFMSDKLMTMSSVPGGCWRG
jgi:glucosamine-6-phosphate deaminase